MRIDRQDVDGITVLTVGVPGEIDIGNCEDFRASLLGQLGDSDRLVIDCALVDFFDSAGMGSLLAVQREVVQTRKGRMALASVNRAIHDIFRMVGFDMVFVCLPDVPEAVASLKA